MNAYQIETSISDRGIIKLTDVPHLYNKKVKLIIISSEDKAGQRKNAMKRLLEGYGAMPANQMTDDDLDNIRYKRLQEKHQ